MKPINGYGFFVVSESGVFTHVIIFEYLDKELQYYNLIKDEVRRAEELAILRENMQEFLNEEEVLINGERSYMRVEDVEVGFAGNKHLPYIQYIVRFLGSLKKGVNVYEDRYSPERTTYRYSVAWLFPPGTEVLEVKLGTKSVIKKGHILYVEVPKGTYLNGHEKIVFCLA